MLEAVLGGSQPVQQQSTGSSLLDALFGGSSQSYNTYNSYGSMSEQDIYNMLLQAYSQSGNASNAYTNTGSYGSSSSSLLDILTGGYPSTSGSY